MANLISDQMRERAIESAPGPLLVSENGVQCICWAVPQGLEKMGREIDRLRRELAQLQLQEKGHPDQR